MGRLKTITRRSFLIGSTAIAGGVAFGVYSVRKPPSNPLVASLKQGDVAFNPWVKIDASGITLITPHADIGQGAFSMQAALIAEEMDVEFGQFSISPGEPSGAYWNTASAEEVVPFKSTDKSITAETMRSVAGSVVKLLGVQGTGGSSSVPDSYVKLRQAGATARETLKLAASNKSGVPVDQLKTANASVQLPDGTAFSYVELAAEASTLEPVEVTSLRDASTWRMIGKPMQRLDIVSKTTGTLNYDIDLIMDNMVFASVKVNPRKGGELKRFNAAGAETLRGVHKVVPVSNGVAVVADNTWRAFQALEKIEFEWGDAPYPAEQSAHWSAIENSFTEEYLDNEWRADGAVDDALAGASVIEAEYRAPYVAHQPMQPLSAVVLVSGDNVDVWTGHQLPRFLQQKVAEVTGYEVGKVRLHNQYSGGSFGHRLEFDWVLQAAEVALEIPNVPVKLTYSREEDFAQDYTRQIAMSRNKGVVKDGQIDTADIQIASVSSTLSQGTRMGTVPPGADAQIVAGAWDLPYAINNFRVRGYKVPELAPVSSWRSVGASTGGFFSDCFIDELCVAAGVDPLLERLRLITDDASRKVLEAVAELSGWGGELGPDRGRGVAFVHSFGVPTAEVVEVSNTPAGIKIDKVYVVVEVGQIVDPINFDNLVKGGVVWGLGHAMNCEITYADGMAEQSNFHAHEGMRIYQCPEIIVSGLENSDRVKGIGEPPVPPAAPALANAIFAATGKRIREMPFNKHIDFV